MVLQRDEAREFGQRFDLTRASRKSGSAKTRSPRPAKATHRTGLWQGGFTKIIRRLIPPVTSLIHESHGIRSGTMNKSYPRNGPAQFCPA